MPREKKTDEEVAEEVAPEAAGEKTAATQAPTIQDHRKTAGTPDWCFAAVVAYKRWTPNFETGYADYEKAVAEMLSIRCGY